MLCSLRMPGCCREDNIVAARNRLGCVSGIGLFVVLREHVFRIVVRKAEPVREIAPAFQANHGADLSGVFFGWHYLSEYVHIGMIPLRAKKNPPPERRVDGAATRGFQASSGPVASHRRVRFGAAGVKVDRPWRWHIRQFAAWHVAGLP